MSTILTKTYQLHMEPNIQAILIGLTYAFTWTIIAWIITDQSIIRKPYPYLGIFIPLFITKIYWNIVLYLFPPTYETGTQISDALALLGTRSISSDWYNLIENANTLLIIIEFIVMIIVLTILWYLSHPKDFKQKIFYKSKRTILVILGAFFFTMPLWIPRVLTYLFGCHLSDR